MKRIATDHRALVLESVATSPFKPSIEMVLRDCVSGEFTMKKVKAMIWVLQREGLIGMNDHQNFFITRAGLEYLSSARFDRRVPREHIRPKARRRKGRSS